MGMLNTASGKLTEQSVTAQMHLTGQQAQQLQRIVLAGKKVLFSKESHQLMLKELDGPGTISQKIGQGVAGLMGLLWQESKNSLPPNLLIPAGMVLVVAVAQFLRQAGQQVTDQDIGSATESMVTAMLDAAGVDADKVAAMGENAGKKPAAKAAQPAQKAVAL